MNASFFIEYAIKEVCIKKNVIDQKAKLKKFISIMIKSLEKIVIAMCAL